MCIDILSIGKIIPLRDLYECCSEGGCWWLSWWLDSHPTYSSSCLVFTIHDLLPDKLHLPFFYGLLTGKPTALYKNLFEEDPTCLLPSWWTSSRRSTTLLLTFYLPLRDVNATFTLSKASTNNFDIVTPWKYTRSRNRKWRRTSPCWGPSPLFLSTKWTEDRSIWSRFSQPTWHPSLPTSSLPGLGHPPLHKTNLQPLHKEPEWLFHESYIHNLNL